jgi:excisionase family DNA binding protein
MTVAEVAESLGVCQRTVRRLLNSHQLVATRVKGGWQVDPESVRNLKKRRGKKV